MDYIDAIYAVCKQYFANKQPFDTFHFHIVLSNQNMLYKHIANIWENDVCQKVACMLL